MERIRRVTIAFKLAFLVIQGISMAFAIETDFLSLACGASSHFTGPYNISWTPDSPYIKVGKKSSVKFIQGNVTTTMSLRYFPESSLGFQSMSCYKIPLQREGPHLIRGTFVYKNYDGLNMPPHFQVHLGPTFIGVVDLSSQDPWVEEVIWTASSTGPVKLCLLADPEDTVPVISALELRPLPTNAYGAVSNDETMLQKTVRAYYDSKDVAVRYFPDQFDHIWDKEHNYPPINFTVVVAMNMTKNTTGFDESSPTDILKSARVLLDQEALTHNLKIKGAVLYFVTAYFLQSLPVNSQFDRNSNRKEHEALGKLLRSQQVGTWMNLTINPSNQFKQLKALEIHKVIKATSGTPSFVVSALRSIQSAYDFNLSWANDPCIPAQWKRVTCSFDAQSPSVIALNLSNMDLRGDIVPSFGDLIDLQILDLHNNFLMGGINNVEQLVDLELLDLSFNKLSGSIPDDLQTMTSLKKLYLQSNNLSGTLPATLGDLKSLEEFNVENNELRGPIPQSLNKTSIIMRTSGNICLNFSVTSCSTSPPAITPLPGSPSFPPILSSTPRSKNRTNNRTGIIVGVAVAGTITLLVITGFILAGLQWKKRSHRQADSNNQSSERPDMNIWNGVKRFRLKELKLATGNFKELIGKGSFGPVFLGKLVDGQRVAVKVRMDASKLGGDSFVNEVFLLSQVQHPNLVLLKGYCQEAKQQILVYEYMPGGTLTEHLHGSGAKKRPLDWKTRLRILVDAATGLEYLHNGNTKIIHRDVKSSNILLDDSFTAKVSDFGLSKHVTDINATHVTTAVKGTAGYLDPEYYSTRQLTEKSDVYSLGVVLFEMICGREPLSHNYSPDQYNLVIWAKPFLEAHSYRSVVDKAIENDYNLESMETVAHLAMQCVNMTAAMRPTIGEVLGHLKAALVVEEEIINAQHDGSSIG